MLKSINEQQQDKKIQAYKDMLLGKILHIVSKQKLMPNFLDELEIKCKSSKKKRLLQYKQTVRKIYSEKNKFPLIYDPSQAYTQRQKLQQKIQKSQNHELDIEYLQKMKLKQGRIVPTYKGFPLDSINYPTKKQFEMFQDFNEKKFLKNYSEMFDDKLELKQPPLLRKQRVKTIAIIPEQKQQNNALYSLPKPKFNQFNIDELKEKQKDLKKVKKIKLRPLTEAVESQKQIREVLPKKSINQKYKPHLQKVVVGKMIKDGSRQQFYKKMIQIGHFPPRSVSQSSISLTKESFSKYLKQFYERQIRIVDFLQIKPTISLEDYCNYCTKLKLMSVQHVIFMTFLFYDFNNDGYICDHDIRRIKAMVQSKKNFVIEEDLKVIEQIKERKQYQAKILALKSQNSNVQLNKSLDTEKQVHEQQHNEDEPNYHELYKLPQVTQSTFFNWLNKQRERQSQQYKINNNKGRQKIKTQAGQQQCQQQQQPDQQNQQNQRISTQPNIPDTKKSVYINPFNPSVMKYKYNYFDEKAEVKKYILNIKAKKTYISFFEFRKKFIVNDDHKNLKTIQGSINQSRHRRMTENVSNLSKQHTKKDTESSLTVGLSRNKISRSQIKIQPVRKNTNKSKSMAKQKILRPFLWYDLMDKLGGIRYEGLRYT